MNFDLDQAMQTMLNKPAEWIEGLVAMLPNLLAALLIVALFWIGARVASRLILRGLNRATQNHEATKLLSSIVYIAILLIGLFTALDVMQLKKTVTSLLAGVGILGLALGFAFQDLAANFVAGVMMAIRRPFKVGDIIKSESYIGTVKQISLRSTLIRTFDGQIVQIPNKRVFQSPLENFSRSGERRIDIEIGVAYGDDLQKARQLAIEAVEDLKERDHDKEPEAYYGGFGDSSINLSLRIWIRYPEQSFLGARSVAIERVKAAFDEAGITIPFPIRTLDFGVVGGEKLSAMLPEHSMRAS